MARVLRGSESKKESASQKRRRPVGALPINPDLYSLLADAPQSIFADEGRARLTDKPLLYP
jgi:hypothetical protein